MKEDIFRERLRKEIELAGNQTAFARLVGVSQSQISEWLGGRSLPQGRKLVAIAENTGKPVSYWAGETDIFDPDSSENRQAIVKVPLLSVSASAGAGSLIHDEGKVGELSFARAELVRMGVSIKDVHLIKVAGDSMEPTIQNGRLVMIDASQRRHGQDGIYAIRSGEGEEAEARIKRLRYGTNAGVEIISDNAIYPVERVPNRNEIVLIGRAVWTEKLL